MQANPNNRIHEREEEGDDIERDRNRQRLPDARVGCFRIAVPILVDNINVRQGHLAGIAPSNGFDPDSAIISLQSHLENGPRDGVILAVILSINTASGNKKSEVQKKYAGANRGAPTAINYSRRIVLMCLSSDPGTNTFIMFQGSNLNVNLLDGDVSLRDNGGIRPGAVVLLRNPSFTDTYLSNSSIPILKSSCPLLVVDDNFTYPEKPILATGTDTGGSILHNVRVTIETVDIHNTPCNGRLCDQQSLMVGHSMSNRCACVQMNKSGKVGFDWGINVEMDDGSSFRTQFMSKQFTLEYILTEQLSMNVSAANFDHYMVTRRLLTAGRDICRYINERGGFIAIIWVKRGEVLDQGVDQPNNGLAYNAQRTMVESGNLNHHVVRLFPMHPVRIEMEDINAMKFNSVTGFSVNV